LKDQTLTGVDFIADTLLVSGTNVRDVKITSLELTNTGTIQKLKALKLVLKGAQCSLLGSICEYQGTYTNGKVTFKFNPGVTAEVLNNATILGSIDGQLTNGTIHFNITDIAFSGYTKEEIPTKVSPLRTLTSVIDTASITIEGHSPDEIRTKNTSVLLDTIVINLTGIDSANLKKIQLVPQGDLKNHIQKVTLAGKELLTDSTHSAYTLNDTIALKKGENKLNLNVVLDSEAQNNTKLSFKIETKPEIENVETSDIEIKNQTTKTLLYNDPLLTVKGEEGTGTLKDLDFDLGTITFNMNGVSEVTGVVLSLNKQGTAGVETMYLEK